MKLTFSGAGALGGFVLMALTFTIGNYVEFGSPFLWAGYGAAWFVVVLTSAVGGLLGHPFRRTSRN